MKILKKSIFHQVLEVNASSRRQGRQVMTQLAEATQSHSVSSKTSQQPANTLTAMFAAKATNTKPSPKKGGFFYYFELLKLILSYMANLCTLYYC